MTTTTPTSGHGSGNGNSSTTARAPTPTEPSRLPRQGGKSQYHTAIALEEGDAIGRIISGVVSYDAKAMVESGGGGSSGSVGVSDGVRIGVLVMVLVTELIVNILSGE